MLRRAALLRRFFISHIGTTSHRFNRFVRSLTQCHENFKILKKDETKENISFLSIVCVQRFIYACMNNHTCNFFFIYALSYWMILIGRKILPFSFWILHFRIPFLQIDKRLFARLPRHNFSHSTSLLPIGSNCFNCQPPRTPSWLVGKHVLSNFNLFFFFSSDSLCCFSTYRIHLTFAHCLSTVIMRTTVDTYVVMLPSLLYFL